MARDGNMNVNPYPPGYLLSACINRVVPRTPILSTPPTTVSYVYFIRCLKKLYYYALCVPPRVFPYVFPIWDSSFYACSTRFAE